jgi:hypothetical protein
MSALTDSMFWLAFFTVAAIVIVTAAVTVALCQLNSSCCIGSKPNSWRWRRSAAGWWGCCVAREGR